MKKIFLGFVFLLVLPVIAHADYKLKNKAGVTFTWKNLSLTEQGYCTTTNKGQLCISKEDIVSIKEIESNSVPSMTPSTIPAGAVAGETKQLFTDIPTGIEFVFVKGGCYQMGDTFGDGRSDEKPVHEVCVDDFYIGKYEVTQGQWKTIMGNNPSRYKGCGDNCPVESVSWNDIQDFINKLNQKTGKNYRLPTEAEWEYAARSGGKSEKYSGTNSEFNVGDYAWYANNSGGKTHPAGQKKPNGLGVYDMSGNVDEWVSDWYNEAYYRKSPKNNPIGSSDPTLQDLLKNKLLNNNSDQLRVFRGGSCGSVAKSMRTAIRNPFYPKLQSDHVGFRLSRTQ